MANHGKSLYIIYKRADFHSYVSHNQRAHVWKTNQRSASAKVGIEPNRTPNRTWNHWNHAPYHCTSYRSFESYQVFDASITRFFVLTNHGVMKQQKLETSPLSMEIEPRKQIKNRVISQQQKKSPRQHVDSANRNQWCLSRKLLSVPTEMRTCLEIQ